MMKRQTWPLAETETTFNQCADDRSQWRVYSADPYWIRRLEAIGAVLLRDYDDYQGKLFQIRADQMVLRKGKRHVSEEQREALLAKLQKVPQPPVVWEQEGQG